MAIYCSYITKTTGGVISLDDMDSVDRKHQATSKHIL